MNRLLYELTGLSLGDSEIIAACGLIVAMASVIISVIGVWWTRKYTIRAMRPVLVPSNHTDISRDGLTYTYEFAVDSVGAGPAIILTTRFYFEKNLF